jgi:hypothetical protein
MISMNNGLSEKHIDVISKFVIFGISGDNSGATTAAEAHKANRKSKKIR